MKIKDVEKQTGITSYNIRFYEKENLLIPKRNPVNGYREYTEEDILLLNRIKMLRMLDIPVSDIRKILYEKEALTSVLNTHLLKIKEEENRLRQNYFLCEELIKMDMSVTDLSDPKDLSPVNLLFPGKRLYFLLIPLTFFSIQNTTDFRSDDYPMHLILTSVQLSDRAPYNVRF